VNITPETIARGYSSLFLKITKECWYCRPHYWGVFL